MTPKEVSKELRGVAKRNAGRPVDTFEVRVSDMAAYAADAIDALQELVDRINDLPSCHDCKDGACKYRPELEDTVRYNCHMHTTCRVNHDSSYWLKPNPNIGRTTSLIGSKEPTRNSYETYLFEFANNHGISLEEARQRPMVKARLDHHNKTGL